MFTYINIFKLIILLFFTFISNCDPYNPSKKSGLKLNSSKANDGFENGGVLPIEFRENSSPDCLGNNEFPKLTWNSYEGSKSYVIIFEDKSNPWVHLNLYNLGSSLNEIPRLKPTGTQPKSVDFSIIGGQVGKNSYSTLTSKTFGGK